MKLRKPLPKNRSFEQVKNHYLIEKEIAKRLKESDRNERKLIFDSMYDELFNLVPDHPRLTRRNSDQLTAIVNKDKLSIVERFLDKSYVFGEFAPGDCRFAFNIAKYVQYVVGIDISNQRNLTDKVPENFKLIIYDGYNLNEMESNTFDILFSDQLIEHIHPDDTKLHFELAHRILKVGGKYIFRTPHSLSGPYDISRYFSDEPECFHLKEWTYLEIKTLLLDLKYANFQARFRKKTLDLRLPFIYFAMLEKILKCFPKHSIKKIAKLLIPTLYGVATK